LLRKTLVSVRVPSAATLVVISELSGPGDVVGLCVATAAFAFAFVVWSAVVEQLIPTTANSNIVSRQIFCVTLLSS
jgi:Mg2+/Co2+ transporter CorB